MPSQRIRKVLALSLEEKILNIGSLFACVCVFFPWVGGEWLGGNMVTYSGLGFFTSFIGVAILLLHVFTLLVTIIPLTGGPVLIRPSRAHIVRLFASACASVLTVAVWSVLTKFTFEFSRLQIYFGLYGTLVGSIISTLYSFLLYQDDKRNIVHELFYNTESTQQEQPQVPPSPEPEEHNMHSSL